MTQEVSYAKLSVLLFLLSTGCVLLFFGKAPPPPAAHPLLFFGGVGASMMMADLDKPASPQWYCKSRAKDYHLWFDVLNFMPFKFTCWLDNVSLRWRDGKMESEAQQGVRVKFVGDELADGQDIKHGLARDLWSDLLKGVSDLNYSGTSPNVRAFHYDWRKSIDQLEEDGSFERIKRTIETLVKKSGGQRVALVTLSYGGPLMHTFLATYVNSEWKNHYVERWISMSGVFGGSAFQARYALFPDPEDFYNLPNYLPHMRLTKLRDMSNTFASQFILPQTYLNDNEALVTAAHISNRGDLRGAGPRPQKVYTRKDFGEALADSGLTDALEVYKATQKDAYFFHDLPAPGVTIDCVYGIGQETISSVIFGNGFNKPATGYTYEDGDGVSPTRSLSLCSEWNSSPSSAVNVYPIANVGHGGTLHSEVAVELFSGILRSMPGFASTQLKSDDASTHADSSVLA